MKIPNWLELRNVGQLRLIRSSYIWLVVVPLVARFTAKFPPEYTFTAFDSKLVLTFDLPFSWTLFYYSAISIAIATTVFNVFCPEVIRLYETFAEFEHDGKSQLLLQKAMHKYTQGDGEQNRELTRFLIKYCCVTPDGGMLKPSANLTKTYMMLFHEVEREKLPDAFHYVRQVASSAHKYWRLVSAVFYAIGFLLLSLVFIETLYFVIRLTIER